MATPLADLDTDIANVMQMRDLPSVTVWERLDPVPRAHEFNRALRAEVRDPLWMLSRQWQLGEFEGDDAGSPVFAKLQLHTTRLTGYGAGAGAEVDFDDGAPLEARVAKRPLVFEAQGLPASLDVRLLMGRHWLKLLQKRGLGAHTSAFRRAFSIATPPAADSAGAPVRAHRETWQLQAALGGRAMDGRLWYEWLIAHREPRDFTQLPPPLALDGLAAGQLSELAIDFLNWFRCLFDQPELDAESAWQPQRLEYHFSCSAPVDQSCRRYTVEEYPGGKLDWYALDRAADDGLAARRPEVQAESTTSFIPVPVEFNGSAHPRWWSFEDRRVNFAGIRPDTTDLAKLLMMEFGLVYANDWSIVPLPLAAGTLAEVRGLVVTNVFGERLWIDPAGTAPEHMWQRWRMFGLSQRGTISIETASDATLALLPTVPKVQESPPFEAVALIRDEMANMVWAIEQTVPLTSGLSTDGARLASETATYHQRLHGKPTPLPLPENDAKIRYELMTSVPEHWIPFVPVRTPGSTRDVQLQRGSMPRVLEHDPNPPERIKPRTSLLRAGLDQAPPVPYFLHEEEVPRAGVRVTLRYQRTRWTDGRAVTWLAAEKQIGRGEGTSGLCFDRIAPKT